MTSPRDHEAKGVVHVPMDIRCLDGDELWVCLVQTAPVDLDSIRTDSGRPAVVATLQSLLAPDPATGGPPRLDDLVGGKRFALVVAPECSLGSQDSDAVDQLVRGRGSPLVLLVGFGATAGPWFDSWAQVDEGGGTRRIAGWTAGASPSSLYRYNGGWCWVHDGADRTSCVTYLKNYPEQRLEIVQIPDLDLGRSIVRVDFEDLVLFPLGGASMGRPTARFAPIVSAADFGGSIRGEPSG